MENKDSHWNQKVAKNRGPKWRKNLLSGRLEIQMNPTPIRLKRISRDVTQRDIAKKLGVTYTTYGAIEAGRRTVRKEIAEKICKILDLSLNSVFASTKSKSGRLKAVTK